MLQHGGERAGKRLQPHGIIEEETGGDSPTGTKPGEVQSLLLSLILGPFPLFLAPFNLILGPFSLFLGPFPLFLGPFNLILGLTDATSKILCCSSAFYFVISQ